MSVNETVLQIFRDSGALLDGHFILRSGLRSRQFFQCAQVCQYMDKVTALAEMLLKKLEGYSFETVIAPAMGGLVIGQEVARQAGVRFIFVEKENDQLVLRRNFKVSPGEKVLIVEDVVTRGGRANEAIAIAQELGAEVAALSVLVDRSSGKADFAVPFVPLISMNVETFDPNNLPEDLEKIPAVKPGS
ncbi:orotate phosphoribosyltransferase [Puniceicoccus vermicola]|uniref:Orotate phosphoribosyltransferase n=1 Tax=Puniceicoccus vermicola TaxID=388746 RepID=A0A7X1B1Y4_9BACT|nr:orotate phosphoribosyltransferase [Puniceicoccus vermicola]MBC2604136.1 orotate phosphoribosyltransferase [Puniceicoccus vermicola]